MSITKQKDKKQIRLVQERTGKELLGHQIELPAVTARDHILDNEKFIFTAAQSRDTQE